MARHQLVVVRGVAIRTVVLIASLTMWPASVREAKAHEVGTHVNITDAAVQYLRRLALNRVDSVDPRFACENDLATWLREGVILEDDLFVSRPVFHFDPRLTWFNSSCTSTEWAFGDARCISSVYVRTNIHRWQEAMAAAEAEAGFRELGWVLHLLEDLTSPAHVRNDPHIPGYDSDPLEAEIRTGRCEQPPVNTTHNGV